MDLCGYLWIFVDICGYYIIQSYLPAGRPVMNQGIECGHNEYRIGARRSCALLFEVSMKLFKDNGFQSNLRKMKNLLDPEIRLDE